MTDGTPVFIKVQGEGVKNPSTFLLGYLDVLSRESAKIFQKVF